MNNKTILIIIAVLLAGGGIAAKIYKPVDESLGIIQGTVLLGPTCPVMRDPPDPQCADRAFETDLVLTTIDQAKVIKKFRSDTLGRFNIEILPGNYAIRSAAAANILPYCAADAIIVKAHDTTVVTVNCDSGIR